MWQGAARYVTVTWMLAKQARSEYLWPTNDSSDRLTYRTTSKSNAFKDFDLSDTDLSEMSHICGSETRITAGFPWNLKHLKNYSKALAFQFWENISDMYLSLSLDHFPSGNTEGEGYMTYTAKQPPGCDQDDLASHLGSGHLVPL